jgi:hypothetical protein
MAFAFTPRSVGLMLAVTAFAGWFEAGSLLNSEPRAATAQQSSRRAGARNGTPRTTPAVVPEAARLHDWRNSPPSPTRGRNPFVFGARATSGGVSRTESNAVANVPPPPVVLEPAMPIFRLSGIASNSEAGTVTLTAIIIDNGSMVFAKAGDKLSNGYSVVSVEETLVTLVDATGVTQTIKLP